MWQRYILTREFVMEFHNYLGQPSNKDMILNVTEGTVVIVEIMVETQ